MLIYYTRNTDLNNRKALFNSTKRSFGVSLIYRVLLLRDIDTIVVRWHQGRRVEQLLHSRGRIGRLQQAGGPSLGGILVNAVLSSHLEVGTSTHYSPFH